MIIEHTTIVDHWWVER